MFSRLPESNAPRQRRAGGLVVSTVLHVVFIALAVRATMLTAAPPPEIDVVTPVYVAPVPEAPRSAAPPTTATRQATTVPNTPAPLLPEIPAISDVVPSTLPDPAIALGFPTRNDFRAPSVSGGDPSGTAPNVADGAPLPERFVDKVIVAIPGTATPRYPSMLQSAGVEGDVRAQFVVDTLGRVEQGSVRVLDAAHDQFAAAVLTALARARFKPAEAGGRKVRQLAEQTFTFRLDAKD
jgi:periplasmic protein TonB